MKKFLLIISLISMTICGNEIRKMVNQIASQIGEMEKRLKKAPTGIKSKFHPVVSKGYEYYAQRLAIIYNPGIMDDYFEEFLRDIIPTYIQDADYEQKKKFQNYFLYLNFQLLIKFLFLKFYLKKQVQVIKCHLLL